MSFQRFILALVFLPSAASAQGSADYRLEPGVVDFGGLRGGSADYIADFSTTVGGAGSSTDCALRLGYAGQLADAVSLSILETSSPMTLNERSSRQLEVTAVFDDDTTAAISAAEVSWMVQSGPIASISSLGLMTAGSVYQNSAAVARAAYGNLSDKVDVAINNVGTDDFGSYAADGLPDLWQVQYFGANGSQAGPAGDGDGDGLNNLQEFAFGTNPFQGSAAPVAWEGGTLQAAGAPTPFASGSDGSFTFRAVFARRVDYLSASLTYTVEFSGDLVSWKASTSTPTVLAADSQVQAVSVPYPFFVNGKKARFFRVKVQSL